MKETNSTEHLPHYRIRPRFKVELDKSVNQIVEPLKNALAAENADCVGKAYKEIIVLKLPVAERHFWSPQLRITMEEVEEKKTLMRGLYGPNPEVWTLFVFGYSIIGFAAFVIAIVGFSRLALQESATILWLLPVLILLCSSLYLVAYLGQKASRDQMMQLQHFLEVALDDNISSKWED